MKILCFIDSLGSGGAQRQLATLAVLFKKRGHQVRFLVYHPHDHFLPLLQAAGILCQVIPSCSHWRRVFVVRQILRQGWQDVVLAFLEGPCFYAELALMPEQRWGLVAGEQLASPQIRSGTGRLLRQLHRFADVVVSNSYANQLMLRAEFPFLRRKLATIYNLVDLQTFHPSLGCGTTGYLDGKALRIVVAASYQDKKNMIGVAEALLRLKGRWNKPRIVVDWFGGVQTDSTPFKRVEGFVAENGLEELLRLHQATRDIAKEYSCADAVGLFSFFEGLPNAVCEGMACGKPILLSDVCDAGNLVREGKNGFLCDPSSPESIADTFVRFAATDFEKRRQMGLESRTLAEELFDEEIVIDRYENILQKAMHREAIPMSCSWPADVPKSAMRTVGKWADGNRAKQ